jgi:type IV secretion system protein VirB4
MWLAKWLEILITARGYEMKAEDDKQLYQALESVYAQPKINWKLQSLVPFLSKPLAEQMGQWVGDGQMAKFFDNREDSFSLGEFSCIEIGGLFYNPRLATAFMEYAFFRLQQKLDGKPTIIYIEEAWFMLGDPAFASRINDWLKTLRKKNAFVVMATQSLEDISSSNIFSTIIDNIPNRIYLPNLNAYANKDLYLKKFGLNETQLNDIRNAVPKSNYYIVTPLLSRMVNCHFPPKILACLRSDTRAQNMFDKLEYSGIKDWQFNYIQEMSS